MRENTKCFYEKKRDLLRFNFIREERYFFVTQSYSKIKQKVSHLCGGYTPGKSERFFLNRAENADIGCARTCKRSLREDSSCSKSLRITAEIPFDSLAPDNKAPR